MGNNVENLVVEAQFKNKQFESGVAQSLSTIQKLKQSLKFEQTGQSLSKLGTLVGRSKDSIGNLGKNVDQIAYRFSKLGMITTRIFNKMISSVESFGSKMVNAVYDPLVHGGIQRAMDISQAQFMVEGLGQSWEKVRDAVDAAVTGTAYGFDEAARAAAQLGASGVEAGDTMTQHLLAVAGTAAMTGATFTDIADVFTAVAGQGKVMAYQLNQLSFRGLNAAAILGEQLGKTEAEIREMVSKGEIDFNTFSKAMYEAFGEHAKDANKTFTGSLANMKAAIKRIGQDVALPSLDHLRDVFNAIKPAVDKVHVALGNSKEGFLGQIVSGIGFVSGKLAKFINGLDFSWVTKVADTITNIFYGMYGIALKTGRTVREMFPGSFTKTLTGISDAVNKWSKGFKDRNYTSYMKELKEEAEAAKKPLYDINKLAKEVINGDYGNGDKRVKELHAIDVSYAKVQNRVNELLGCEKRHKETQEDLAAEERRRKSVQQNLNTQLTKQVKATKEATTTSDKLANIIGGMIAVVKMTAAATSAFYKILLKPALKSFLNFIFNAASKIGAKLIELYHYSKDTNAYTRAFIALRNILVKVGNGTMTVVRYMKRLGSYLGSLGKHVQKLKPLETIMTGAGKAFNTFMTFITGIPEKVRELSGLLGNLTGVQHLITTLSQLRDLIVGSFVNGLQLLTGAMGNASDAASNLFTQDNALNFINVVSEGLATLIDLLIDGTGKVREFFSAASDHVGDPFGGIGDMVDSLKGKIKQLAGASADASGDVTGIFDSFKEGPATVYQTIKKTVEYVVKGLADGLAGINLDRAIGWAKGFASIYLLLKMVDLIKSLKGPIDSVKAIPDKISGVLSALAGTITKYQDQIKADLVWALAKSILAISASLLLLSGVETEKLYGVAFSMAMVIGAVALLVRAIGLLPQKAQVNQAEEGVKEVTATLRNTISRLGTALGETIKELGKSAGLASVILAVGVSISLLVKTFVMLAKAKVTFGEAGQAAVIMLVAAIALGSLTVALSKFADVMSIGTAATVYALASAVAKIAGVVVEIGNLGKGTDVKKGVIAVGVLLLALGEATNLAGKSGRSFGGIVSMAITLMVLTKSIKALLPVVEKLGNMDNNKLIQAKTAITEFLIELALAAAGLGVAVAWLKDLGDGAKNLVVVAGALLIMAAAMRVFAPASYAVGPALAALVVSLAAIAGVSWLFGQFPVLGTGLEILAVGMLQVGGAALMFGLGAAAFGIGVVKIGEGLTKIGQGMRDLADGFVASLKTVSDHKEEVKQGISDTITSMADGVSESKEDLKRGAADAILAFCDAVIENAPKISETGKTIFKALIVGLVETADFAVTAIVHTVTLVMDNAADLLVAEGGPFWSAAHKLVNAFGNFLQQGFTEFFGDTPIFEWLLRLAGLQGSLSFPGMVNSGLNYADQKGFGPSSLGQKRDPNDTGGGGSASFGPETEKAWAEAEEKTKEGSEKVNQATIEGFNKIHESAEENSKGVISDPVTDEVDKLVDSLQNGDINVSESLMNSLFGDEIKKAAEENGIDLGGPITEGMAKKIAETSGLPVDAIMEVCGLTEEGAKDKLEINSPSKVFERIGNGVVEGLVLGLGKTSGLTEAMSGIVNKLTNAFKGKSFGSAGRGLMQGLITAVKSGISSTQQSINSGVVKWVTTIRSKVSQFTSAGKSLMTGLRSGISGMAGRVASAVSSVVTSARSAATRGIHSFHSIGSSMMTGLRSGIISMASRIASAAAAVVARAIAAAKAKAKINSPSKEFMWIGEGFGEGMIKGIGNMSKAVAKTSSVMTEKAIDTAKSALTTVADLLSTDAIPVITPVIDTSNVYATAADINALFGKQSVGLNANINALMNTMNANQNRSPNSDVVRQLKALSKDIANMPRNNYNVNGVTYDDGSNIHSAIETLIRATVIEGRA